MSLMLTQASVVVDTWQVRVHDLIARGVAEARRRRGWTQEQAARAFRGKGLTAWRTSTVGSLEAGLRRPRLDEVLLMARALEVTLDELLPGDDEHVDMGDGAVMTPRGIRELLKGGFDQFEKVPAESAPYESFPEDVVIEDLYRRSVSERERLDRLLQPITQWCDDHGFQLLHGDYRLALGTPADAERHAARRLGVEPAQVKLASRVLWDHRDFGQERDARIGDTASLSPRSLQARRGLVTRDMLSELGEFLRQVYGPMAAPEDAVDPAVPGQQPIVTAIVTSRHGVLIGRRNDGIPPWSFIAGEQEPGEQAADTIIREVKEETGLDIRAGKVIGERDHPATGRHMIYLAARPVRGTAVHVGDEAELAEVRWVTLAEAEDLLPRMFEPVHEHLARTLAPNDERS